MPTARRGLVRRSTRRVSVVVSLAVVAGAMLGCQSQTLSARAPEARNGTVALAPLPPLAPSVVDAPISYALAPAIDALERAVPRHFGDIAHRIAVPSNSRQQFAFEATRTPFVVAFDGHQVTLASTVSYQGKGWYKPMLAPTVSASCGISGAQPRMRIVIAIDVDLTREWIIRTKSRVRTLRPETDTPRDACRVTPFHIDVTDRVLGALRPVLQQQLPVVDRQIAAFDVRSPVERWFNLLNKSLHVHDSVWLVLAPEAVRLGGFRIEDRQLVADVRLYAHPVLVTGPQPPPRFTVLPPLERAVRTVGDSARLRLEGVLGYDLASGALASQLVGRTATRYGRSVTVDGVRVYALRDGRLVLAVRVSGDIRGEAFLVGTPRIDTIAHVLTVPDLDFDVATADALVRGLAWLRKADLVTQLRERARLSLDPLLDASRAPIERAINRTLTEGVRLTGRVRTGRILDVAAEPEGIRVRADATGVLALAIDRDIPGRSRRRGTEGRAGPASARR